MRGPATSKPRSVFELWTTLLDRQSHIPLSVQLATSLRRAISDGRVAAGARLPSTRALSREIGISRSTVVTVFEQLVAEGFIRSRVGSGFYVPDRERPSQATPKFTGTRQVSRHAKLIRSLSGRTGAVSSHPFELGNAQVDGRLLATWKRLAGRALSGNLRLNYYYASAQGQETLRQAIADYLSAARAVRCRPEQIIITSGTQQSLSLAARLLIDPGDPVWLEDPCYPSARDICAAVEAEIVPIPVDERGMNIPSGEMESRPPRLIYVTPSHHFPLGGILPISRRLELLERANQYGSWILEDDYDSEFHYDGRAITSLQGLDSSGRVIYLGTFSKVLFPSFRLGYMVLPEDLVETFVAAKQLHHRQNSVLLETIAASFITEGHFARHLKRMRQLYSEQLNYLVALLEEQLPPYITVQPANRGMHLILWLPKEWSDREVAAALRSANVSSRPLSSLTIGPARPPALVLGYTGYPKPVVQQAVYRMVGVFRKLQWAQN